MSGAPKRKRTPDSGKAKSGGGKPGGGGGGGKKMKIAGMNQSKAGGAGASGAAGGAGGAKGKARANPESGAAAMSGAGPQKYQNPRYLTATGEKKPWKPRAGADSKDEKKVALTREDRKELRKTRRAAKPNAEVVAATNSVYNVGLKDMKKGEREATIEDILTKVKGKLNLVGHKHDASRALQSLIKNATPEQRALVFEELRPNVLALAKHNYGHHLILKCYQYGSNAIRQAIASALTGHIAKLATHTHAAQVIDYIFASGKGKVRSQLLVEFYGPEYTLLSKADATATATATAATAAGKKKSAAAAAAMSDSADSKSEDSAAAAAPNAIRTLDTILAAAPNKKDSILKNMETAIQKAVRKELVMFRYVHTLCREYIRHAPIPKLDELRESLIGMALALHGTMDGAWVAGWIVGQSTPKDRKTFVKSLKENVQNLAQHETGWLIVARSLLVIDDTVLTRKSVLNELTESYGSVFAAAAPPSLSKLVLSILNPRHTSHFTPAEIELFQPAVRASIDPNDPNKLVSQPTSKKPPQTRRAELLIDVLPELINTLSEFDAERWNELIRMPATSITSALVFETIKEASFWANASGDDKTIDDKSRDQLKSKVASPLESVLTALAGTCAVEGGAAIDDEHPLQHMHAHLLFKQLLKSIGTQFGAHLWSAISDSARAHAAYNRGAFILTGLIEHSDADTRAAVVAALKPSAAALASSAAASGDDKKRVGIDILLKKLANPNGPSTATSATAAAPRTATAAAAAGSAKAKSKAKSKAN